MRFPPRITRTGAAAAVLSALLIGGTVTTATPAAAAVGSICYTKLPSQAHDTLDLIDQGGPYPYSQDGSVFQTRESVLPSQSTGYYHEYTVITPGSSTRRTTCAAASLPSTYVTATSAPSRASRTAVAAPIPRAPPVTSATLPFRVP